MILASPPSTEMLNLTLAKFATSVKSTVPAADGLAVPVTVEAARSSCKASLIASAKAALLTSLVISTV